ncbi:hypothetical protein [Piscinibacter terrae]|uniref:Uncharacterized protein n=1 Tax=Piscinibacter terrae TaxID=2496871 RepID=A0A3N7HHE6_9BURK|nr:hypothetical protein [Albitalea terrae]RQP21467.1 hypothetical protein DZC73_26460 [Albitalea terrae]
MKDLVKNPIGIVALFISLIYGFANLLLGTTAGTLTPDERYPLIIFITVFPLVVLGVFYLLVSRHHGKLYAPGDFKDDKSFLRTLSKEEVERKLQQEVTEAALPAVVSDADPRPAPVRAVTHDAASPAVQQLVDETARLETAVVQQLEKEYGKPAVRDVEIASTGVSFDALLKDEPKLTFAEVKVLRNPLLNMSLLDRVLYNALLADRFMNGKFKLVLVIVYHFDKGELPRIERTWRRKVERCPAEIELRFLAASELAA